jgi:outer membrane biosynthesis protein TonB
LKGKLQVAMVVQPGGGVSKAWVKTQSFKGSVVGRCIVDSVRNWRFPKFEGEAQEIELPFVFERGG